MLISRNVINASNVELKHQKQSGFCFLLNILNNDDHDDF